MRGVVHRDPEAILEELIRFQDELPDSWKDDAAWALDDPEDLGPIPEEITRCTVDMREVLASWREADASAIPGPE